MKATEKVSFSSYATILKCNAATLNTAFNYRQSFQDIRLKVTPLLRQDVSAIISVDLSDLIPQAGALMMASPQLEERERHKLNTNS